jgi:hypothetical protein
MSTREEAGRIDLKVYPYMGGNVRGTVDAGARAIAKG